MRVDVLTIFPEYLAPLELSLIGKARRDGLLDIRVQDLREYTQDRHRTVDDTPYGGGAGMVMRPEPWGQALDALVDRGAGTTDFSGPPDFLLPRSSVPGSWLPDPSSSDSPVPRPADPAVVSPQYQHPDPADAGPVLIVPGPAGRPFTQSLAADLALQPWLAFTCGRYEGIDERVYDYASHDLGLRVEIVSLGDYVLNGGEVAVLAMIEAIARLVPGVIGNAESLVEESHADWLLEYPVYTKPASWRGRDVPAELLSGDHARIAAWRNEQRLARTAARRPDLLPPSAVLVGDARLPIRVATPSDAAEIFVLQRSCWLEEGRVNADFDIPPLVETLEQLRTSLGSESGWRTWVVRDPGDRLVASVRGRLIAGPGDDDPRTWEVGRLMVAPDLCGRGLGRTLLEYVLAQADPRATRAWLITGAASTRNQRIYRKAGFRIGPSAPAHPGTVEMVSRLRGRTGADRAASSVSL